MALVSRLARGRLHYGWLVAALTFVTVMIAAGARSAPGAMIGPLWQEFGWSGAPISWAGSVGLMAPGGGRAGFPAAAGGDHGGLGLAQRARAALGHRLSPHPAAGAVLHARPAVRSRPGALRLGGTARTAGAAQGQSHRQRLPG